MKFLIIFLVILIAYGAFRFFRKPSYLNILTEDEFQEGYRKAQLIDVREANEFENGHILGARNIPVPQLSRRLVELRKDKPVYLYCQNTSRSVRAAQILHKNDYEDISILDGGFKHWTGRVR